MVDLTMQVTATAYWCNEEISNTDAEEKGRHMVQVLLYEQRPDKAKL
jgi:hypothetical protein